MFWLMKLVTVGITALSFLRVLIEKRVCDLDVGPECPKDAAVFKGWSVRPLKFYVIWVQTGVSQVSFYLLFIM